MEKVNVEEVSENILRAMNDCAVKSRLAIPSDKTEQYANSCEKLTRAYCMLEKYRND